MVKRFPEKKKKKSSQIASEKGTEIINHKTWYISIIQGDNKAISLDILNPLIYIYFTSTKIKAFYKTTQFSNYG